MSSLHHENILEDCFEVSMESFRVNNKIIMVFHLSGAWNILLVEIRFKNEPSLSQ